MIDHSVQVDEFGTPGAFKLNAEIGIPAQPRALRLFALGAKGIREPGDRAARHRHLPPGQPGISGARGLCRKGEGGKQVAYPDTVVGTDSHTTMINGLGVLGWGVGGIEAEAAMLGQPISMLIPQVVGVRLSGHLPEGSTATDLVLTITQMLRKKGVVGKFVEYFGPGLHNLPLADRAVIANMSPEYGSTCGIFPVDEETLRYLRLSGRSEEQVKLVESYCKEQGLFHTEATPEAEYSDVVSLDLATVEPSIAGPKRPQDRVPLSRAAVAFREALPSLVKPGTVLPEQPINRWESEGGSPTAPGAENGNSPAAHKHVDAHGLHHGSVVIAAITSCTNTSNPPLLMAAGLVAKKAVERGLQGSVVGKDLARSRIAGGDRVSEESRADALSRQAAL